MPITLDNTSITGLGVGGLPAGSVNATSLANNAVTREKMGYSGAVLQVINRQHNGTTQNMPTSANARTQLNNWSQTITKIRSNSKILCHITFYTYIASQLGGWWGLQAQVGGSAISGQAGAGGYIFSHNPLQYTFAGGAHQGYTCLFIDERDQTTITYDFFNQNNQSINLIYWNNGVTWTFIEVAA